MERRSRAVRLARNFALIAGREVSEAQALQLAHGYLHDNATNLYGAKP